jgi:hypothetical protein
LLLFQDLKPGDNVLQLPDTPLVFDAPTYGVVHLHQHGTTAGIDRAALYGVSNPIQYDLNVSSSAWGFPESLPPFDPRRRRSSSRAGSWAGQYGLPRAGIVLHGVPAFVVAWHSVCSFVSPVNRGEGYTGPPPAVRYRRRNAAKGLCWACSRSLRIRSAVRLGRSSSRESCGVRLPMDGLNRVTSSLASGSGAGLRHMCRPAGARRTPASAA